MKTKKRKIWIAFIAVMFTVALIIGGCTKSDTGGGNNNESPSASSSAHTSGMKAINEDVVLGDTLSYKNFGDIKLTNFAFEEVVKPSSPAQFFTSYKVHEAGNVYAHLTLEVYNAYVEGMLADDFFSLLLEDDGNQKNYTGFAVVEINNGSDLALGKEHLIPPLTSATVHLLTEVPKSVTTSGVPYKLQLQFKDRCYRINPDKTGGKTYTLGDWADGATHDGALLANVEQHSLGDAVQNGQDAYTVQSITFENTVRPPNAAGNHINFELTEEGQTYAHVVVAYKNGSMEKLATQIKPALLFYKDFYSYTGECVIEEPGGKNFTYPNLVEVGAGEMVMLHYMMPVPTEVQENTGDVLILLDFGDGLPTVYKLD